MNYVAPQRDLAWGLEHLAALGELSALPGWEDATVETARAVLAECARFSEEVLAPLARSGDLHPAVWRDGAVAASPGFADAYRRFAEGGWQGLQHPAEHGGQGLPKAIAAACAEMLHSANMAFALCPLLTDGAIEALTIAGTREQQALYLPKLIEGRWTGTMNLTEPQAGSDLSLVRCKAVPQADGRYRLSGQKIFITWGEHDLAENILHLVLARTPDSPPGVKGISLFLVPKFLVDGDGGVGARNDVACASIEHKLGIRASPTAVMVYGGGAGAVGAGAIGELVGAENRGLETMFIMMNAARYAVGLQGIAVAERAYQQAVVYARDRVQSRPVDGSAREAVAILRHPDVRRMLLTARAQIEGARALALVAAAAADLAARHPDAAVRDERRAFHEFLVPVIKGASTEMSVEAANLALQVHGGMGYIEETGAAQWLRDARILPIYEGTTAIQANDFVGRKTARDGGATARRVAAEVESSEQALAASSDSALVVLASRLRSARGAFLDCVAYVVQDHDRAPNEVYAGSVPYLLLAGHLCAGWQLARAALKAAELLAHGEGDTAFLRAKIATARFHGDHLLPRTRALRDAVVEGGASVGALAPEDF